MTDTANRRERSHKVISKLSLRLLLSLGSVLITLTSVELGLRILKRPHFLKNHTESVRFAFTNTGTPETPIYVNHPGRITFRYDGNPRGYFNDMNEVHHDVNPTGFRGPAFTPKPDGTIRLVFLGDSFTFGEGVHNHDTYPKVAARLLRKDEKPAESYNLGVGGYNTAQEADVLRLFGFDLQPDVVIVGYTLNDAEPPLFRIDPKTGHPVRRAREAFIEAEAAPRKAPKSPLYRLHLAQAIWQAQRQRKLTREMIDYYHAINADDSAGRQESERALREIIEECNQRDIPCIVVMFPILYELSDDYPFSKIHQRTRDIVLASGGQFIDLLPALIGMDARKLTVHPTDQHPNETVHAIAGRLVAEKILKMPNMHIDL